MGRQLASTAEILAIQNSLSNWSGDSTFYFVAFSSGCGKTQLAFSLESRPVVYFPFPGIRIHTQPIYDAFAAITREVQSALQADQVVIDSACEHGLDGIPLDLPMRSVGLMLKLLQEVIAQKESPNILLPRTAIQWEYQSCSVAVAEKTVECM